MYQWKYNTIAQTLMFCTALVMPLGVGQLMTHLCLRHQPRADLRGARPDPLRRVPHSTGRSIPDAVRAAEQHPGADTIVGRQVKLHRPCR